MFTSTDLYSVSRTSHYTSCQLPSILMLNIVGFMQAPKNCFLCKFSVQEYAPS